MTCNSYCCGWTTAFMEIVHCKQKHVSKVCLQLISFLFCICSSYDYLPCCRHFHLRRFIVWSSCNKTCKVFLLARFNLFITHALSQGTWTSRLPQNISIQTQRKYSMQLHSTILTDNIISSLHSRCRRKQRDFTRQNFLTAAIKKPFSPHSDQTHTFFVHKTCACAVQLNPATMKFLLQQSIFIRRQSFVKGSASKFPPQQTTFWMPLHLNAIYIEKKQTLLSN